VKKSAIAFAKDECGQDVVEYALLMAFLSLIGAALFVSMGGLTSNLWNIVNSRMSAANQSTTS
jgi:Flp pilus assembly pilin Flp